MLDTNHYPRWNDQEHERPVLSTQTGSWLGDWAWLILPIILLGLAFLAR
jgi:hypothetical protein